MSDFDPKVVTGRFGLPKDVPIRVEWRTSAPVAIGFPFCLCTKTRLLIAAERMVIRSFCNKNFPDEWLLSSMTESRVVDYISFRNANHLASFMRWAGMLKQGVVE